MDPDSKCRICQKSAEKKCSGCHQAFYCNKEHQKSDWKSHKATCRPFLICEDNVLGRHLIATKPIPTGEIILKEPPLIWGPSQVTIPVCLGCAKKLTADIAVPCNKCGWPMCSEICQNSPSHLPECSYTVNRGDKISIKQFEMEHPLYQCLTVLRCLYQKQFLPEIWKKLDHLHSHCEERKQKEKYEADKITVVQTIRKFFKLDMFVEEEILRICGIVMINGHEVPLSDPPHVAIYETTSLFEHNCKANCTKSFTSDGSIVITSGVSIKKGDHLSICYTDPLWGTANRRHHLYETKFFWCSCERCSDPTEFGTNYNSMKCQNSNCIGFLLPKTFLENTYEEVQSKWYCSECLDEVPNYTIQDILNKVGEELSYMPKGSTSAGKFFIRNNIKYLHPNHFYLTDIKFALSQLIGQEFQGGLTNITDDDLDWKAQLCKSLLDLMRIITPAEKRIIGVLLFELHAAIAEMGRRKASSEGPEEITTSLLESKKYLQEALEQLKFEPEELPEGKVYVQAVKNLEEIDVILRTVHTALGDTPL